MEQILNFETLHVCIMQTFLVVVILCIVFSIFVLLYNRSDTSPVLINSIKPADKKMVFQNDRIKLSKINDGLTWSIVTWLYIDDWNYKFGQDKYFLDWTDSQKNGVQMYFDKKDFSFNIKITTIPLMKKEHLVYHGINVQKWTSVIVILDNRNLDLFIDGELVKTKKLEFVPLYTNNSFVLFPDGGFNGKVGYLQYMSYKLPQFGIQHFQILKHRLNGNNPFFYSPLFYGILYAFKSAFYFLIIAFDRFFNNFNYYTLELLYEFVRILKNTFDDIINFIISII